ncbi:hypothetical protein RGQ29_032600 [Quercus rubra]|uniref:P-loop containing nucleoside triphosphate hydrolases superfamily protein n=1 Tax=Quercus rubra TaxID=3512 RepID=A0AAN7DV59_QUERU|nr:hypothetical protein RGQ29_032600 [Quercus rubra]KAK4551023.1 hypothetical protein RGQ29_032600 [Quercus rubra]KAK4551025.1 hypothetical protein RGQ29_032600 [Quercus rubra]
METLTSQKHVRNLTFSFFHNCLYVGLYIGREEGTDRMENSAVKKREVPAGRRLIDLVFSWSIEDVLNEDLYKNQVRQIPHTFSSTNEYMNSFTYPLIEETHADLLSSMSTLHLAPSCEILSFKQTKDFKPPKDFFYLVTLKSVSGLQKNGGYEPMVGDIIALTNVRPKYNDLDRPNRPFLVAFVQKVKDDNILTILASKPILAEDQGNKKRETLYAICLINMTTNIRIWRALNFELESKNLDIIGKVLQPNSAEAKICTSCISETNCSTTYADVKSRINTSDLNDSQKDAILSCLETRKCNHQNTVKLIWGPPGTGKTKTVGSLLFCLLKMKCRTLTCAPTNTAVLEVTQRLLKNVTESLEYDTYGLGDILLFGNRERMKIDDRHDLLDVFLDNRVTMLYECLLSSTGWKDTLLSMITLLNEPKPQYHLYLKNEGKSKNKGIDSNRGKEVDDQSSKDKKSKKNLKKVIIQTLHENKNKKRQNETVPLWKEKSLEHEEKQREDSSSQDMKNEGQVANECDNPWTFEEFIQKRFKGISKHLFIKIPVPDFEDEYDIKEFCLQYSCLIFCTVSSSAKVHEVMTDLELLVIDEAAQLKECESTIPLQLPGLRHAILIGDERQLPAMVKSKISEEAEFGRSLFQRLVLIGHKKHLLNVQHRMHPSISLFPNRMFYENHILDGPNVKGRSHNRRFLQGKMYGSYSFINVAHGKEEFDNSHSLQNMVEAAVASEIVSSLFKESVRTKKKVRVGIISPYKAQVFAIREKVKNYNADSNDDFSISVRSVDGFQGGEEDVIIISTVRCNKNGIVGFLKNHQRTNVALTRARYCLWILGNEATLTKRNTIWKELVIDAKKRRCFYNAHEDKGLAQAFTIALVGCNQMHILLNMDSFLFRKARWMVSFSKDFLKSMSRIEDAETCTKVLSLLENLANGWRQPQSKKNLYVYHGASSQLLEQYKVKGLLHLVWTVDILKENSNYIQILKVWDILPLSEMPKLANQLDVLFENYTLEKINHCKHKSLSGCLVVPMRWPVDSSSCPEADPILSLSEPLASLSLRDESESSSTTNVINSKHTTGRSVVTNKWVRKLPDD